MRRGAMGVVGAGVLWVAACSSSPGSPPGTGGSTSSSSTSGSGGACGLGTHLCGTFCAPDTSVDACGTSCSPCPTDPNGDATCDGLNCGLKCQVGHHLCGGACASDDDPATCGSSCTPCPAPAGTTATCTAGVCGTSCAAGTNLCGGTCVAESPTACGPSCQTCPAPGGSIATCNAGACGVACAPGTSPCSNGCCAWTPEVIGAGTRWEITLRVSAAGVPHVAFLQGSSSWESIVHAARGSGGWTMDVIDGVDPDPSQDPYYEIGGTGLALDATGAPSVAYRKSTIYPIGGGGGSQLMLAQQANGTFGLPVQVEGGGMMQEPVNLAFDGMGQLHATYSKCCFNNYYPWMRYGVLAGGKWMLEDGPINVSSDSTSMALAADGTPRVASVQAGTEVDFLDRSGGSWTSVIVSQKVTMGAGLEIRLAEVAIDPSGASHICFQASDGTLAYASEGANAWTIETVDASPSVGEFCSLALDSKGNPLICYRDATNGTMKCASKPAGAWVTAVAASGGDAGEGIDVVFDAQDLAHVVYYDGTAGSWMYLH